MFDFPSPTFFSEPAGICSSFSRCPALRGNVTWGPETTSPCIPCDEGGGGKVLDVLVLSVWRATKTALGKVLSL